MEYSEGAGLKPASQDNSIHAEDFSKNQMVQPCLFPGSIYRRKEDTLYERKALFFQVQS